MYVIAVLCTLKLYSARHADVNVKSYSAYIVLALLVLLGAGTTFTSEFYFKLGFTVVHLIACIALAIDVYYMGHWKFGKFLNLNSGKNFVIINWNDLSLFLAGTAVVFDDVVTDHRQRTCGRTRQHLLEVTTAVSRAVDLGGRW